MPIPTRRSCPDASDEMLKDWFRFADTVCGPDQMRSSCRQSKQAVPLKPNAVAAPNIADGQQS